VQSRHNLQVQSRHNLQYLRQRRGGWRGRVTHRREDDHRKGRAAASAGRPRRSRCRPAVPASVLHCCRRLEPMSGGVVDRRREGSPWPSSVRHQPAPAPPPPPPRGCPGVASFLVAVSPLISRSHREGFFPPRRSRGSIPRPNWMDEWVVGRYQTHEGG
jgi:hypothetical protein